MTTVAVTVFAGAALSYVAQFGAPASHRVPTPPICAHAAEPVAAAHNSAASPLLHEQDPEVAALTELYEENAKWKQKYISTKKSHFSKFFGKLIWILYFFVSFLITTS